MRKRKVTPKQMQAAIELLRVRQLRLDSSLEEYEATVTFTDHDIDKAEWLKDLERLRGQNRINRERLRQRLSVLEDILAEDEQMNSWKGEDRFVEGIAI